MAGCCIATDSWTNIQRKQIMAFMAISSERKVTILLRQVECCNAYVLQTLSQAFTPHIIFLQVVPTRSIDTTSERHFAHILCAHMVEELQYVEKEFGITVKAIITDAASDCRKARSLLFKQYPHLVSLDCFAHHVSDLSAAFAILCLLISTQLCEC